MDVEYKYFKYKNKYLKLLDNIQKAGMEIGNEEDNNLRKRQRSDSDPILDKTLITTLYTYINALIFNKPIEESYINESVDRYLKDDKTSYYFLDWANLVHENSTSEFLDNKEIRYKDIMDRLIKLIDNNSIIFIIAKGPYETRYITDFFNMLKTYDTNNNETILNNDTVSKLNEALASYKLNIFDITLDNKPSSIDDAILWIFVLGIFAALVNNKGKNIAKRLFILSYDKQQYDKFLFYVNDFNIIKNYVINQFMGLHTHTDNTIDLNIYKPDEKENIIKKKERDKILNNDTILIKKILFMFYSVSNTLGTTNSKEIIINESAYDSESKLLISNNQIYLGSFINQTMYNTIIKQLPTAEKLPSDSDIQEQLYNILFNKNIYTDIQEQLHYLNLSYNFIGLLHLSQSTMFFDNKKKYILSYSSYGLLLIKFIQYIICNNEINNNDAFDTSKLSHKKYINDDFLIYIINDPFKKCSSNYNNKDNKTNFLSYGPYEESLSNSTNIITDSKNSISIDSGNDPFDFYNGINVIDLLILKETKQSYENMYKLNFINVKKSSTKLMYESKFYCHNNIEELLKILTIYINLREKEKLREKLRERINAEKSKNTPDIIKTKITATKDYYTDFLKKCRYSFIHYFSIYPDITSINNLFIIKHYQQSINEIEWFRKFYNVFKDDFNTFMNTFIFNSISNNQNQFKSFSNIIQNTIQIYTDRINEYNNYLSKINTLIKSYNDAKNEILNTFKLMNNLIKEESYFIDVLNTQTIKDNYNDLFDSNINHYSRVIDHNMKLFYVYTQIKNISDKAKLENKKFDSIKDEIETMYDKIIKDYNKQFDEINIMYNEIIKIIKIII